MHPLHERFAIFHHLLDKIRAIKYSTALKNYLLQHPSLKFTLNSSNTETNSYKQEAEYKSLQFEIMDRADKPEPMITILGSVHKYYNDGEHNANDFSVSALIKTVYQLCCEFQLPAHLVTVHAPEIGLNIDVDFCPNVDFFDSLVVLQGSRNNIRPSKMDKEDRKGFDFGRHFQISDQWALKLYRKGARRLRVELHINKNQKLQECDALQGFNFKTLLDFCNPETLKAICEELLFDSFRRILVDEYIQEPDWNTCCKHDISQKDFLFYTKYMNDAKWEKLKGEDKRKVNRRLKKLFNKHASYHIQKIILEQLASKLKQCLVMDEEAAFLYESLKSGDYLTIYEAAEVKIPSHYHSIEGNVMVYDKNATLNNDNTCKTYSSESSKFQTLMPNCMGRDQGYFSIDNLTTNQFPKITARNNLFTYRFFVKKAPKLQFDVVKLMKTVFSKFYACLKNKFNYMTSQFFATIKFQCTIWAKQT